MEALRTFNITLVSANNLPDIRKLGRMEVYAKAAVTDNGRVKNTSVDTVFETNPRWNELLDFIIKDSHVVTDVGSAVVIGLFCRRSVGTGDKLIGAVVLSVKALFDNGLTSAKPLTFDVLGTENGTLTIRYGFGATFLGAPPPPLVESSSGWSEALTLLAKAVHKGLEVGMAVLEVVGKVMMS